MSSTAKMVMASGDGLTFTWSGGEYIEVTYGGLNAVDVINVFDYAEGKPTITTLFDFTARVRRYMDNNEGEEFLGFRPGLTVAEMFFANVKDGSR